jgi:acetyl-CoA acetyltransferase
MNNNKTINSHEPKDDGSYAMREYGVTRDELDRFVLRMNQRIARERQAGRMKVFTGDIEKDIKD